MFCKAFVVSQICMLVYKTVMQQVIQRPITPIAHWMSYMHHVNTPMPC